MSKLGIIRTAAKQRHMVEIRYHGKTRTIEPYSVRFPKTGNVLLMAYELNARHIKAFNVRKLGVVRVLPARFSPRWTVEL